jgi:hypothetical protein
LPAVHRDEITIIEDSITLPSIGEQGDIIYIRITDVYYIREDSTWKLTPISFITYKINSSEPRIGDI